MNRRIFSSLRRRMIALILLGVMPPALIAIGFASHQAARIIRQEAQENLRLRAESLADSVTRWDTMNVLALRSLSENADLAMMDPARQIAALSSRYRVYPEIYGVVVTSPKGEVLSSGRFIEKEVSYANREWFQKALAGEPVTRQTLVSRVYKQPAVAMAAPIRRAPSLGPGDSGKDVEAVQAALAKKGFYHSAPSGHYDEATTQAMRAFQASQPGLPASGQADAQTRALLLEDKAPAEPAGEIIGVVSFGTFLADLGRIVGAVKLGETGFAFLVDERGRVLAHPDPVYVTGDALADFSQRPEVRAVLDGHNGLLAFSDNRGTAWLSYGQRLANGWSVIALQQESEVLSKERRFWQVALAAALLAALMIVALAWMLADSLSRPVLAITQAAVNLSKGHLDQHVESLRNDELGTLADAFNQMAKQLRISFAVLESKREEADKARAEAVEANKAKSVFVANMTHELRTPLNAIIGYGEMLQDDLRDAGQEDYVPDLEKICVAGKHLLSLVNDVLDFSKVEAGRMELYLEHFGLDDLLGDIEKTLHLLIAKNTNRLVLNCPPDIGGMFADLTKTRQCLFNLLSNANKFTHHGELILSVSRYPRDTEEWISFEVRDTGIGMTEAQMSKLFHAFSQADSSTTRKYGGTGLGLVITKQFCEMMGGFITVSSEFGAGSVFTMHLPAKVQPLAAQPGD